MPTQYLTDKAGNKVSVVIPVKDFERMLEELDELDCIKAYDKAKSGKQHFIRADIAFKEIDRKRKIKKLA
jgi:hypothetical protein